MIILDKFCESSPNSYVKLIFLSLLFVSFIGISARGETKEDFVKQMFDEERVKSEFEYYFQRTLVLEGKVEQADKDKVARDLVKKVDLKAFTDQTNKIFREGFSEEELNYLLKFRQSGLFKKYNDALGTIKTILPNEADKVLVASGITVMEKGNAERKEPSWLTKMIWRIFPDTRQCVPKKLTK